MAIDKLTVQAKLAQVIKEELTKADTNDSNGISQAERDNVHAFIRPHVSTGNHSLASIKDRAMTAAMTAWAKHNSGDKKLLTDKEISAITKDDPLLGELTKRAVALAKVKPQTGGDAITLEALPASHKLRKLAEAINEEWGDANITSSKITVKSGRLTGFTAIDKDQGYEKREKALRTATSQFLKASYEQDEGTTLAKAKSAMQYGEWQKALPSMMKAVAEDGFGYAPENASDRKAVETTLKKLIAASGAKYPIVSEAKDKLYSSTLDEKVNVSAFLISDIDSGEYIAIYVREGSI